MRLPIAGAFVGVLSLITPPNEVDALLPPTVSVVGVPDPDVLPSTTLLVPAPLLDKDAIAGVELVKVAVAVPALGVMKRPAVAAVLLPKPESLVTLAVPASTVTLPRKVFAEPNVIVPVALTSKFTTFVPAVTGVAPDPIEKLVPLSVSVFPDAEESIAPAIKFPPTPVAPAVIVLSAPPRLRPPCKFSLPVPVVVRFPPRVKVLVNLVVTEFTVNARSPVVLARPVNSLMPEERESKVKSPVMLTTLAIERVVELLLSYFPLFNSSVPVPKIAPVPALITVGPAILVPPS